MCFDLSELSNTFCAVLEALDRVLRFCRQTYAFNIDETFIDIQHADIDTPAELKSAIDILRLDTSGRSAACIICLVPDSIIFAHSLLLL